MQQAFQEFSIGWLLLSAGVGGLIGALIKFVFEEILQVRYRRSLDSRAALRKYTYPLLRSVDTLDKRLENMIQFVEKKWFDESEQDYYKLSTLYLFGCYLGWCKILEDEAFLEFEESDKRARLFNIHLNRVFKSITSFKYFHSFSNRSEDIQRATPPRLSLTAIGELMLIKQKDQKTPEIINFVEFTRLYNSSKDFKKWFYFLEQALEGVERDVEDPKWNRLVLMATNVRAFVFFLDRSKRQTKPRSITYLEYLHPKVAEIAKADLIEMGHKNRIVLDNTQVHNSPTDQRVST